LRRAATWKVALPTIYGRKVKDLFVTKGGDQEETKERPRRDQGETKEINIKRRGFKAHN